MLDLDQTYVGLCGSEAVADLERATHVIQTIAPIADFDRDPLLALHGPILRGSENLQWVGYLSSTGVYGDHAGAWIDEDADLKCTDAKSIARVQAEQEWRGLEAARLQQQQQKEQSQYPSTRVDCFRCGGIYGPGRGPLSSALANLKKDPSTDTENMQQPSVEANAVPKYVNRIHVDDICEALIVAIKTNLGYSGDPQKGGSIYNLVDDDPAPRRVVVDEANRLVHSVFMKTMSSDEAYQHGVTKYQTFYNNHNKPTLSTSTTADSNPDLLAAADFFGTVVGLETKRLENHQEHISGCDCGNLLVALRSLAAVYASLGDYCRCVGVVDAIRYWKARKMPFSVEESCTWTTKEPEFEWIYPPLKNSKAAIGENQHPPVALRTLGEPLIDTETCTTIQNAAKVYRECLLKLPRDQPHSTRFTMQYPGNSDLHVADLVAQQPKVGAIFDELLQRKLYPLVRSAYLSSRTASPLSLCVYDALIVRYDGDEATQNGRKLGASLPLVRDKRRARPSGFNLAHMFQMNILAPS